jgi:Fic family protein
VNPVKASEFSGTPAGRLVETTPSGVHAFVPNRLPPDVPSDHALAKAHSRAEAAVRALVVTMPAAAYDPYYLVYPLMAREAYYSSLMEGTYTTPENLALFDLASGALVDPTLQTKEVVNYVKALELGRELLAAGQPVSSPMIRRLHATLLTGTRGEDRAPGQYRKKQNFIGRRVDGIENARFVPPPGHEVEACMADLDSFVRDGIGDAAELPTYMALAYAHYQFETIHPFADGNGRIGRLLVPLVLMEKGVLQAPVLHLSPVLEKQRDVYIDLMYRVSQRGAWRDWVLFFLKVVEDSATEACGLVQRLAALKKTYEERVTTKRSPAVLRALIEGLFLRPSITFTRAAEVMGVSHAQAAAHVRRLVQLGILKQAGENRRNMRFIAPEILDLVFGAVRELP